MAEFVSTGDGLCECTDMLSVVEEGEQELSLRTEEHFVSRSFSDCTRMTLQKPGSLWIKVIF